MLKIISPITLAIMNEMLSKLATLTTKKAIELKSS